MVKEIEDDMFIFLKERNQMVKDIYADDIEMQVVRANREGDIGFLQKMAEAGHLDVLYKTSSEKWNYLHRINLINPAPPETVQFYLDRGVPVNAQDCYGMTPLHYAMRAKNAEAALLLLEAGADPNIPNRDNVIPLGMIGCIPQRLDVLESMLKKGGNVHYSNANSGLPLIEFMQKYFSDNEEFKPIIQAMLRHAGK